MNYLHEFMDLSITYKICVMLVVLFVIILLYCIVNRYDLVNTQQYKMESFGSNPPTFTMYYTDWCGYCKKAKPEFKKCMDSNPSIHNKKIDYVMVDCDKDKQKAKTAGVSSYPTFILNVNGKKVLYEGERNYNAFKTFLEKNI